MKRLVLILLCFVSIQSYAQFPRYSSSDVIYKCVGEIDYMKQNEIKDYNYFINHNFKDSDAILLINCARANENLKHAPATIISYTYKIGEDGKIEISGELINTTIKTIKKATLTFDFTNDYYENAYDTKTAKKYLTVSYENLKGRTSSNDYIEIRNHILDCYHRLNKDNETSGNTFYNKIVSSANLSKALIEYTDGTSSQEVYIFDGENLLNEGPLEPVADFKEEQEVEMILNNEDEDNNETEDNSETKENSEAEEQNETDSHALSEIPPHFKGNVNAWLAQNLVYPKEAAENGVQGNVFVKFAVLKDGSIRNAQIVRSVDPAIDREALRCVNSMPKWEPGYQDGKPVTVYMVLRISFHMK